MQGKLKGSEACGCLVLFFQPSTVSISFIGEESAFVFFVGKAIEKNESIESNRLFFGFE